MGDDHALLVGLNYKGSAHELGGAENDAALMKETLVGQLGLRDKNVVVVKNGFSATTIEAAVARANAGRAAQFWLFFAGHGQQVASQGSEEEDGRDESIVTSALTMLTDDTLRRMLAKLHNGCTAIAIFDCCHSTSMLDLPNRAVLQPSKPVYKTQWVTVNQMIRQGGYRWYRVGARWRRYYIRPVYRRRRVKQTVKIPAAPRLALTRHKQPRDAELGEGPRFICISAAQENQSSVGIKNDKGKWAGAFTMSLCAALTPPRNLTTLEVLSRIEATSRQKGISQISSISSSTPLSASTHLFSTEPPPILLRRNRYRPSSS